MNAWLSAARPRTLPAAVVPVLVGAAHAWHQTIREAAGYPGGFHWWAAIGAFVTALLIQIGTNLANDYYDHVKGTDRADRAGPRRASASGDIAPHTVRNAAFLVFGLAGLVGLALVASVGAWWWLALLLGVLSVVSGLLYTAGPAPLGYLGLGELFVLVFFGPVAVVGTVLVCAPTSFNLIGMWLPGVFLGVEVGLLASAILVVNNLRDAPTDRVTGKRTLAVRFGDRFSLIEYTTLVALPFILLASQFNMHPQWRLLLGILALPLAIAPLRLVWRPHTDRRALNPALGQTALLLLAFGLLSAFGLAANDKWFAFLP